MWSLQGPTGLRFTCAKTEDIYRTGDLRLLRETVKTKLNLEMAAIDEMVNIAMEVKPDMVTLVPEKGRN